MKSSWIETDATLQKTLQFSDFKEALLFINRVGEIAERLQHHPDIGIKDYNTVCISTTTHDKSNTITTKDRELVEAIDAI